MAQLAIKGHPTRGKEVIEILEMLGGRNTKPYLNGNVVHQVYHIRTCNNEIVSATYTTYGDLFKVFTLEEFLEKFPYKVGDKVRDAVINDSVGEIISAQWGNNENQIIYVVEWDEVPIRTLPYYAIDLQPYKEETMENKGTLVEIDLTREESKAEEIEVILGDYEFVLKDGKTYFVKKKPKYPKTYEECYDILGLLKPKNDDSNIFGYRAPLLSKFQKLLVCRDAYWKIASEQLELDKSWEPDWKDETEIYYIISYDGVNIKCYNNTDRYSKLAFPTLEMRDVFYKNFKDLIEQCKELL